MRDQETTIGIQKEKAWIEDSKRDIQAFESLYMKYYPEILRFIYRRTDNQMLAEDLCANTFYKALSNIKKYEFRGKPFGNWLYRIAANEVNKHFKNKQPVFVIDYHSISESLGIPENNVPNAEAQLQLAFAQLSDGEIKLIELKHFEGYTFKELSLQLGEGESAIKMRHYRLLEKMKNILNQGDEKD
ncbi:MAG: sigma-70 family RNA polymerase sigma factor [Cyclobacteriaceae bacterium]